VFLFEKNIGLFIPFITIVEYISRFLKKTTKKYSKNKLRGLYNENNPY